MSSLLFLYIVLLFYSDAYRILVVFPVPSRSHSILGEGYVKYLARAGHEITYVTPLPMKHPPPGVRQIDISENEQLMPIDTFFDTRTLMNQDVDLQNAVLMLTALTAFANVTFHIDNFQKLVNNPNEEFDAVVVEWLYTEMFSGLAAVFNCPLIWSSSMDPHSLVLDLIDEYLNPAYTFHHLSRNYGFEFWQRVNQLWLIFNLQLLKWKMHDYENEMYASMYENTFKKRGRQLPPYQEVKYNASLMLGNSYISTSEAIRLPQNYKAIGGYHIEKEIAPLPENLQKIMDEAKHGVIYFSLGSMLKSSRIPKDVTRDILNVFRRLNQTVIWKFEEAIPDLPQNVHVLPWAQQTSILAHPNCILFITHGGLLSKLEALHFGLPIIGLPLYGDQYVNINRAEINGFGKRVALNHDVAKNLDSAIREILTNSSYRERIKEFSFIHHHRPVLPEQELVHWIEHVIKTRGAMHLRSPAIKMPWYQKCYLDMAFVFLLIVLIPVTLCKQIRVIYKSRSKKKQL